MSLFNTILQNLGFGSTKPTASTAPPAVAPASTAPTPPSSPAAALAAAPASAATPFAAPPAISQVDVVARLDAHAADSTQKLNWKVSIVDMLKLLKLDSSLTARQALAAELGCPAEKMGDSAQMNMWLHKTVLQRLAANGGNIPKELL